MADIFVASTTQKNLDPLPATSTFRHRRNSTQPKPQPPQTPSISQSATGQDQPQHLSDNTTSTTTTESKSASPNLYSLERDYTPYIKILEPLPHRIHCFVLIWILKIIGTLWIQWHLTVHPQDPKTRPDLTKRYAIRPNLDVDIFFPPSSPSPDHDPSSIASSLTDTNLSKPKPYPLYISLHGGGLVLGNSKLNNTSDRSWSRRTGCIVASLNYSKAPMNPYPDAAHDVASLAAAVITDPTLPIDHNRVTIGGFSAGALLALSAAQLAPLRGKLHGVVAYYPCVDFSENPPTKFARRLDRTFAWEGLNTAGFALDWAYVSAGRDRRDRVLSPNYADREDLPDNVCIVGCQYDMFCREGRDMIFRLAGREIMLGDEEGWKKGFETGRQKWVYARGMRHAFTEEVGTPKGSRYEEVQKYCEWMYDDIHRWLVKQGCV